MTTTPKSSYRLYYGLVTAVWLLYAAISLTSPQTSAIATYHISGFQLGALKLTIIIPLLLIWLVAAYGALRFRHYSDLIAGEPDGKALRLISIGLGILVAYLISSTFIPAILPHFLKSRWLDALIVAKSHVPLVLGFMAFALIHRGSARLLRVIGVKGWSGRRTIFLLLPYCLFAGIFTWVFFHDPNLQVAANDRLLPSFVTSSNILIFSYVIPSLVMWFCGCLAALNISAYAKNVRGPIYRTSLLNFVTGIIAVVIFTIVLQLMTAASTVL